MKKTATRRNLWVLREAAADRCRGFGLCPTGADHASLWNRCLWRAVHKALHPHPVLSLPVELQGAKQREINDRWGITTPPWIR
jgi:hypothetical protein